MSCAEGGLGLVGAAHGIWLRFIVPGWSTKGEGGFSVPLLPQQRGRKNGALWIASPDSQDSQDSQDSAHVDEWGSKCYSSSIILGGPLEANSASLCDCRTARETNRKLESLSKGNGRGLLAECGRGLSALGCKFPSNVKYTGKNKKGFVSFVISWIWK